MSERIVHSLATQLDRRAFLRRSAATVASVLLGLFGLASPAFAVLVKCCNLCYPSSGSCHGTCSQNNIWCWFCDYQGVTYGCCEKFYQYSDCIVPDFGNPYCSNVMYSCLWKTGYGPEGASAPVG